MLGLAAGMQCRRSIAFQVLEGCQKGFQCIAEGVVAGCDKSLGDAVTAADVKCTSCAPLSGLDQSDLDNPSPQRVVQLLSSPTEQLRELTGALEAVATGRGSGAQKPAAASSAAVPQPSASHSPAPGNSKVADVSVGHRVEGVEGSSMATSLGSSFDETIYDDSTATTAGVDGAASSSSSSSSTSAATAEPASNSSSSSDLERAAETRQVGEALRGFTPLQLRLRKNI